MTASEPGVILLGGDLNAVSAARSLGRRGRDVHVFRQQPGASPVCRSRFVSTCPQLPAGTPAGDAWMTWVRPLPRSVVIPLSDVAVEFVSLRRSELGAAGHAVAEGDDRFLQAMLDKEATYRIADAAGVERPRTAVVQDLDQAVLAARDIGYPCALKPRSSHRYAAAGGKGKAVVVRDEADLVALGGHVMGLGAEMLLTEIIPGPEDAFCSYYGYIDADGAELLHYTKRKLRQYPIHFGGGTYHLTEHVPDALDLGRRFLTSAGLVGIGNVEFKRDARDGRLKLIECNPRLTAAIELVRRSGLDLAEVVYRRALGRAADVGTVRQGLHQWLPLDDLRAMRAYRRSGELSGRAWLRSLLARQSLPLLALDDPGPSLASAASSARAALQRPPTSGASRG